MLDSNEIKKRLKGVDPQLCVAFAARCSLRVLPLLVTNNKKKAFLYWDKIECQKHLLALLIAQNVSVNFSVFGRKVNFANAAIGAYNAATGAYNASINAYNAASTAHVVAHAASDFDKTSTNYATNAAVVAADASDKIKTEIEIEIRLDLENIKKFNPGLLSPADFIYTSLWSNQVPIEWQRLHARLNEALISLDAGFDLWVRWYQDRIDGVPLNKQQEEQWINIPPEIRKQGAKATNNYLASLVSANQEDSLQPLNLVRAIFIGNGAAGKTSLIRKLYNEPVVEGKEEMTPGIEIREWPVPETGIKARFWDFGGQVMSHSTHQFFLRERCLYILVLDARSEFNANDQAEYWLEHVKAFGNAAPVMLVGNKSDLTTVNLDMNALREKYSNIVDFYPVSCVSEVPRFTRRYELFCADLTEQLKAVGTHQVMFTNSQFEVLTQVRELSRKNAFLDHEKFNDLCKQNEIGKVGLDQQAFLGLLDSLGEIIHFPDLEWTDAYVLNPRWLTYGGYALLYSDKAEKQQGVLSHTDVISILRSKKVVDENGNELTYPKEKCRFIIDAMSKFKLCYCLPEDNKCFVIPDKLPAEQPDLKAYFDKNAEGTLAFKFDFQGLLPRNVMPNLIVTRHREIINNNKEKQLVWQHGVIIRHHTHEATARLQVDYHQRSLQLWIQGKEPREYLVILRDEIYRILDAIKGLSVKEYVILPEFALIDDNRFRLDNQEPKKTTYQSLLEQAKAGQTVVFSDAGNQYNLEKVMGFIMTKKQQKKEGVNVTYNIDTVAAMGGVGDNHQVSGEISINLTPADIATVTEFQASLSTLMQYVQNHDADFEIKADAYAELKLIREHLDNLESASPETKSKLQQLLANVKNGSLGALELVKDIKECDETVAWLVDKAVVVSALLAGLSV